MSLAGRSIAKLSLLSALPFLAPAAPLPLCTAGARSFLPCELGFEYLASERTTEGSASGDSPLNVEFRSPRHITFLMEAFADGSGKLRVRFSPTEAGVWSYHVSSSNKRYDGTEGTFTAADSGAPGMVSVANVRHWWTTNKQPHLWLSAAVPWLELDQATLEGWLDARKRDGFTHIRGTLLTAHAAVGPAMLGGLPNPAYFAALDERVLAAAERGFTLDLLLADDAYLETGAWNDGANRDRAVRYLVARYGGLNVTWQGIEQYETVPEARAWLSEIGAALAKYDSFHHPRGTDARDSSFPLVNDGWMNFLVEGSPHPEVAAVDHQFTEMPEIHVTTATEPKAFRDELWNATTNGEYPSVSYAALRNEANVAAVRTWYKVMSDTRHWEFEPYFDVSGARAVGLTDVEYLAFAEKPGIVEINLPRHKYNPLWVNPKTGEEIPLKDYKGEVLSRETPDREQSWILQAPREGRKENMLKYYRFDSQNPPVQEVENDPDKAPFSIADPLGDELHVALPAPFGIKPTKVNRATRTLEIVWWGEVVGGSEGARLMGVGSSGTLRMPKELAGQAGGTLQLRVLALNANGKAYELNKVYRLIP